MPRPLKPWYHSKRRRWVIKPDGHWVWLTSPGPKTKESKEEAWKTFHRYMAFEGSKPALEFSALTVLKVIQHFCHHDKATASERTYYERKRYLELFAGAHGFRAVDSCGPLHLSRWLDDNAHRWKSGYTLSYAFRCVMRAFNWAAKAARLIKANPFAGTEHPRVGPGRVPMPDAQFRAILAAAPKRLAQALLFLRITGVRPGELRCYQRKHLTGDCLVLPQHKTAKRLKDPSPRVLHLPTEALALVQELLNDRQDDPEAYLFVSKRGTPYTRNALQQNVCRLSDKLQLTPPATLYGLRHSFGTRSILAGIDPITLAKLMGHASLRMTERYVHLVDQQGHLAGAMQRVSSLDLALHQPSATVPPPQESGGQESALDKS